jgi:hypothetical protein
MINVLMTGTMYLHSHGIRIALAQTLFKLDNPDLSVETVTIMERILKLWAERKGPWKWRGEEERATCSKLLQVSVRDPL